jgi:outer membrane protein assembly factor BamE (lipoprotein component of BamABCDE complex)
VSSVTVVALTVTVAGCGGTGEPSAADRQQLRMNAIHVGDSKTDVYRTLGSPEQTDIKDGRPCWYYSVLGPNRMTQICFEGQRVSSKATY